MRRNLSALAFVVLMLSLALLPPIAQGQDSTPVPAARCLLTPREGYANVRSQPTVDSPVVIRVNRGEQVVGIAALYDRAGALWYFTPAGWTADVAVTADETCTRLFAVSSLALAQRHSADIRFDAPPSTGEADSYVDQASIYGNVPRTPALTVHQIDIRTAENQEVCSAEGCDHLTLLLYVPSSGRVTGFFSIPPGPGITPEPPSLDTLLYTSPAECLPLGSVCLVGIVRTPPAASTACPAEQFAGLINAVPITHPDPESPTLPLLVQDLREAALRSLDVMRITPANLPPLGETDPCEFELLIPSSLPGEVRFSMIDGGITGFFDVIRVSPPAPSTAP
ncbi:MAG: SH3 domain-containing protein [Anaerolineae bacterium]